MEKKNVAIGCLVLLAYSLLLTGCDADKKAKEQVDEAVTAALKAELNLAQIKGRIANLEEELKAVKEMRDQLDQQVQMLTAERDNAVAKANQAQEAMQDMAAEVDDPDLEALQSQIAQLKKVVAEQQALITEQQAMIEELANSAQPAEETVEEPPEPVEPNDLIEPNEGL